MLTTTQIQWIASAVSALIAGLVAIGATVAIEKLGGLLGGVIASTPTTIVPSLLGLYFSGNSADAIFVFAMNVPPPLLLNSALLLLWKVVNQRLPETWSFGGKLATLIVSVLSMWFCGAAFIVFVLEGSLDIRPLYLGISCLIIHLIFGVLTLFLSPSTSPKGSNKPSPWVYLLRGSAATTTIFLGSIVARTQPSLGGFVSCFPVIYLTTMIGVWVSQGDKVAAGAAGPMVLGGLSVSIFAFAYGVLFAHFGWLSSAIMAYLIAVLGWSIPLAFFLRWFNARIANTPPTPSLPDPGPDPIQKLYELDVSVFGKQSTDLEEGISGARPSYGDTTDDPDVVKLEL